MINMPADICVSSFLNEANRLGVGVRWEREMINLDAAYVALPGRPGEILLYERSPRPNNQQLCTLLTHEMVHVLQHWKGKLKATPALGWPVDRAPEGRNLSLQEREAYTAQSDSKKVLKAVRSLKAIIPKL